MKKIIIICFLISNSVFLCGQAAKITDDLSLKWETGGFDTPESILLNEEDDVLYVSNIGGKNPLEKDGNGFISILKQNGELITLKWIEELNAPKGMALYEDFLYVTDIDRVVKIDIEEGKIVGEIKIEGAIFLNDVVALENGELFVSDSKTNKYILISGTDYKTVLEDDSFGFINGIALVDEEIYTGVGDKIIMVSHENWNVSDYILGSGGVDGIALVEDDLFVISDWTGRVHLISPDEKKLILDTTELEGVNAADFYYNRDSKLLFIPTFYKNTVACYKLNK